MIKITLFILDSIQAPSVRLRSVVLLLRQFFVGGDSEFELSDKVNKLLDKLSFWCTANKLSLALMKHVIVLLEIIDISVILNYFLMAKN